MCYYASKAEMGCKRAEDPCQTPEGGTRPKAPRERLLSRGINAARGMHPATRDAQQMVPWQKMLPSRGTLGPAGARRAAAPPRHAAPHCCSPAHVPGAPAALQEAPWWHRLRAGGRGSQRQLWHRAPIPRGINRVGAFARHLLCQQRSPSRAHVAGEPGAVPKACRDPTRVCTFVSLSKLKSSDSGKTASPAS